MHVIRTRWAVPATVAVFVATLVGSLAIGTPSAFGATPSAANSTVAATSPSVTADGTTDTITVTLLDSTHTAVVGDTVTLTPSGGSSLVSAASGPSSAGGVVTFTVSDLVAEGVTYTARDTTAGVTITQTAHVTFTAGPTDAATSTVSASPDAVPADGATQSTVTVTLLDANSNPVVGDTVTLTPNGGSSIISAASGPSNASGVVTFTVTDTVAATIIYTARDTTAAVTIAQTPTVYFIGPADAALSTVTASPTSVPADGVTQSTITVTLFDANDGPIGGDTVTLTANGGSSIISAASGLSDANGVVTFTVKDATVESVIYTAHDTTVPITISETATVNFTPATAAATSTVTAAPTSVTANGTTPSTITVTLLDAAHGPVVGHTVTLTPSGGSSTISAASGPSNASGVVTFTVKDATPETVTYTAHDTTGTVTITETAAVTFTAPPQAPPSGYWLVAADGGIFTHGDAGFYGSQGATQLNSPIVGMASTPDGKGYWLVAADGGIFTHGDAGFYGSQGATHLNSPIVGMASTPDGKGYWLVAADGGIFTHGDAGFYGSQGATQLNSPIVGMASTPDGAGYWLVAADGGIFTHGDAGFYGSQGATHLNSPIVGMASTPDGAGYWLVAADGGIFTHGDAGFYGSQGATHLNSPIVGMASTADGAGYWLVAADGGIFTHGDAPFDGSQGATQLNSPIVGMASTPQPA